jgi:hypothetical protein
MKLLLRAAITAASIASIAPAYAGGTGGAVASVAAQAPARPAAASDGNVVRAYVTQSSRGTWLFPPRDGGGANS